MQSANICLVSCALALVAGCNSLPAQLDPSSYGRQGITSGIDDMQTDVAFLDKYRPSHANPTGLVPRGPNRTLLALPGLWEGTFRSYCLHAGVQRPNHGDGYAYVPLKGPDAPIIRRILQNQLNHPEIEQRKIQSLIWAILARTKLSSASPEIRDTARVLLSPDDIERLNGGALGKIPPELLNQIIAMLPPELRQAARVNADLRKLLDTPANVAYEEIERIAAPLGNLPAPAGSRDMPAGRWSYDDSQRVFVRYFPNGYSSTRVQFYAAEKFALERDQSGRISAISDRSGIRLEFTYKPDDIAAQIEKDAGVRVRAFTSIRLTAPDRERPWESNTFSLEGMGWVLTGVPNGSGQAAGTDKLALQQRYDDAFKLTQQVRKLGTSIRKRDTQHALDEASLVELGEYAAALQAIHNTQQQETPWMDRGIDVLYRAWMSHAATGTGASAARLMAASGSSGLGTYDPSGSGAQPGNTGSQRLGETGNDNGCENGAERKKQLSDILHGISYGSMAMDVIFGEGHMFPPFWLPELVIDHFIIKRVVDEMGKINDALAGCPSPPSARVNLAPANASPSTPVTLPSLEGAKALHEFVDAWGPFASQMQETLASQEQYRLALAADDKAAGNLARELIVSLRASGREMLKASARLSALSRQLRSDGSDPPVTLAAIRKYQEGLRANGFSKTELEATRKFGMSDQDVQAELAARLKPVTGWQDTTLLRLYDDGAAALRDLGRLYSELPVAD